MGRKLVSRRVLVWSVAAALVSLAVVSWWRARRHLDEMQRDLGVRSYALLGPQSAERTVNDPRPGSVSERLAAVYPILAAELLAWDSREEPAVYLQCAQARDGLWPLAALPGPCRSMVAELDDVLDQLVDVSRAESLGAAAHWRDLQWWPLARAVNAVALRARIALEEHGDASAALSDCLGVVELWRDISYVAALQTATSSSTLVTRIAPICADALRRADATARVAAGARLTAALNQIAPVARAVDREALLGELSVFAPRFVGGAPDSMHPAARRRAAESTLLGESDREPWWLAPFVLAGPWTSYLGVMGEIAALADTPLDTALPKIDALVHDPALPHLVRTAAGARWEKHLRMQHRARAAVGRLAQIASRPSF